MELSNILVLILLFFLCLGFLGWILLGRLQSLFQERRDDPSLLLVQQQIGDLRVQLGQVLEQSAQSIQQQLGQVLGNVNERLKENAEVLHKTQQNMGERLDNAARAVGSVQKSLGGLEEANRRIYEVGKDIASLRTFYERQNCAAAWANFLQDLLAQILPPEHFSTQYRFRSGERSTR